MIPHFEETLRKLSNSQKAKVAAHKQIQSNLEKLGSEFNAFSLEYEPLSIAMNGIGEKHDDIAGYCKNIIECDRNIAFDIGEMSLYLKSIKRTLGNYANCGDDNLEKYADSILEQCFIWISTVQDVWIALTSQITHSEAEFHQKGIRIWNNQH
jgi:hypothetical protein